MPCVYMYTAVLAISVLACIYSNFPYNRGACVYILFDLDCTPLSSVSREHHFLHISALLQHMVVKYFFSSTLHGYFVYELAE